MKRLNEFRIMWLFVFFDLPTETKKDLRNYTDFRKRIIQGGFNMFQFSIYIRHCASKENAEVHIQRIKKILPPKGKIGILCITDKQFAAIELFDSMKTDKPQLGYQQLELF